jgi:hypothetical protein
MPDFGDTIHSVWVGIGKRILQWGEGAGDNIPRRWRSPEK